MDEIQASSNTMDASTDEALSSKMALSRKMDEQHSSCVPFLKQLTAVGTNDSNMSSTFLANKIEFISSSAPQMHIQLPNATEEQRSRSLPPSSTRVASAELH
jgi:hypothetical protein